MKAAVEYSAMEPVPEAVAEEGETVQIKSGNDSRNGGASAGGSGSGGRIGEQFTCAKQRTSLEKVLIVVLFLLVLFLCILLVILLGSTRGQQEKVGKCCIALDHSGT